MFFRKKEPYKNDLTQKIKANPDIALEDVLEDSLFDDALKHDSPFLSDYLQTKMDQICDMALTNEYNNDEEIITPGNVTSKKKKLMRKASNLLSSQAANFHKSAKNNETLGNRLIAFLDSDQSQIPDLAGHFSNIFMVHSRKTQFYLLDKQPNLYLKFLDKLNLLSYQRFFSDLLSEQPEKFTQNYEQLSSDLGNKAVEASKNKNYDLLNGIFMALNFTFDNDPDLSSKFQHENFIRCSVQATILMDDDIPNYVIIEAYRVLNIVTKKMDIEKIDKIIYDIPDIEVKIEEIFENGISGKDQTKMFSIYQIFCSFGLEKVTQFFFDNVLTEDNIHKINCNLNSFFNNSYIKMFKKIPFKKRIHFIQVNKIVDRIAELINNEKYGMSMKKLVLALAKLPKYDSNFNVSDLIDPTSDHPFAQEKWENLVIETEEYFDGIKNEKYKTLGFSLDNIYG